MTEIDMTISVGGSIQDDGAAFIDAWKRAQRGEVFQERHLAFESWNALTRVLTPKRVELLRHVHHHPEPSVAALARALSRPYRRVHDDVEALIAVGLMERIDDVLFAQYERIKTEIVM